MARSRRELSSGDRDNRSWTALDANAAQVSLEIERLINYTAGDGFIYRQNARDLMKTDSWLNAVATGLAVVFSGVIALLLARRIVGSVNAALRFAERIASGDLDGPLPRQSADELGALIGSMSVMRDRLRAMMQREMAERRSAQARLADALEGSQAGIVMVDASGEVSIANSQVISFFNDSRTLPTSGVAFAALSGPLAEAIANPARGRRRPACRTDAGCA